MAAEMDLATLSADAVSNLRTVSNSSSISTWVHDIDVLSCMQDGFVKNVADVVKMGDVLKVKVLSVDVEGKRLALSRKGLAPRPAAAAGQRRAEDVEEGESQQSSVCKGPC
jgi:general stress protein 13